MLPPFGGVMRKSLALPDLGIYQSDLCQDRMGLKLVLQIF